MVLTDVPFPPDTHSPSMLITDDDRSWRETLREVFEPRGFKTLLAADGAEAWEIVRHESVHVVLLDMHMPKLTGLDLLRQLQRSELKLPCVLMSAAMDEFAGARSTERRRRVCSPQAGQFPADHGCRQPDHASTVRLA